MATKDLFQTLENRDRPDLVERDGPFKCKWHNTWLGDGYYFWDTFIQTAHWWGRVRYQDNHIICHCECDFDIEFCFDLVGSTENMKTFSDCIDIMKSKKLIDKQTTVARVIHYMRVTLKIFNYEAIRVYGIDTISKYKREYNEFTYRLPFENKHVQYLDYKPAIQLCIYSKSGLGLRNFKVIYPDEFNENYVV